MMQQSIGLERACAGEDVIELLRRGFHSVVFQPIRQLHDGSIFGYEALMRGPAGTPLSSPSRIFRDGVLARELMHDVDAACLLSAVRLGRLIGADRALLVNVHGETLLRRTHLRDEVFRLMDLLAVDPSNVVLEISETTGKAHVRAIGASLKPLRDRGVRIALDDVGARYAWLHHMLWLEPELLKLDRSFVQGLASSERKRRLVEAVVALAHTLGAQIVMEGIEREEELHALIDAGVLLGQGYLLGRPLPAQQWFPSAIDNGATVAGLIEVTGED